MKRFLVIQHTYSEFLGLIEKQLESRDIGFIYVRPFTGQAIPASALQHDSLWLLGGATPITDDEASPWLEDERRLLANFKQARRPVVGIGFGALLLVEAAGGVAFEEPYFNAYWTTARKTEAGRDDPVAKAVDGRKVLVMVNGRVELPAGIEPLVVDEAGNWLLVRPDALSYAMLFRPEIKPGMIEDMIMESSRPLPENVGELLEEAHAHWADTQAITAEVLLALVHALDLMRERHKAPVFSLNVVEDPKP